MKTSLLHLRLACFAMALAAATACGKGEATPECAPGATGCDEESERTVPPSGDLAARAVPLDEVPSETLVELYEDALARDPSNAAVRRKFAELCTVRKLPCGRPQLEILLSAQPDDPELRAMLASLEAP